MIPRRASNFLFAATFIISVLFLFVRLGHYCLWDDEAITALNAQAILRTGDTTALLDQNLIAYGGGILLKDLHDRSTPPFPSYLTAPFLKIFGSNSLAARLPFVLLGLGCITILLRWLARAGASGSAQVLFCAALLTNVSFFLYFRNCRYYGPAIFFSVAVAYLYLYAKGRAGFALLSLCSILLLASNVVDFIPLYICLAADYLLFSRHERRLQWPHLLIVLVPLVLIGSLILWIWNPLKTANGQSFFQSGIGDKVSLFFRILRDLNACEYGAVILLALTPLLYFLDKNRWLLRAPLALLIYIAVIALISPTPRERQYADIRYLAPIIPLCIAIETLALATLARRERWRSAAYVIALLAFSTNLLHVGPLLSTGFRSSIVSYSRELVRPPTDPYAVSVKWMKSTLPPRSSIFVTPNHATYPLMFHAPQFIYAWQVPAPPPPQFQNLPDIHVQSRTLPDYVVIFGPQIRDVLQTSWVQQNYQPLDRLGHYWQDRHRPELMFHSFVQITNYDPRFQDIYMLKKRPQNAVGSAASESAPASQAETQSPSQYNRSRTSSSARN